MDIDKEMKQIIAKGGTSRERYKEIEVFGFNLYNKGEISDKGWFSLLERGRKLLGIEKRTILLDEKRNIHRSELIYPEEVSE